MLNRIRLTNFQRHRELEVTFNAGLTALRGANEAGKSTLLRAICYAMFGVKGLGATLDDLVTWGEEPKTLKVELEICVDGVVYAIKRGKSGAEVNYDGGTVTGQNEVTSFVCRLLKCDPVAATRLVMANQGDIRGALEAGAAETTRLIERLAEFDQIDSLIETMQEELTLGSTSSVEAAITAAEKELDAAREKAVEPNTEVLEARIELARDDVEIAQLAVSAHQQKVDAAVQAHNDGKVAMTEIAALDRDVERLTKRIDEVEAELKALRLTPAPDNVDVPGLRQQIESAKRAGELRALYAKIEPYASRGDGSTFTGPMSALEQALAEARTAERDQSRQAERDRAEARLLRQQITDGSCGFCGQDFSAVPAVQEKNRELAARADEYEAAADTCEAAVRAARATIGTLTAIKERSEPALRALAVVGDLAQVVDDLLPPRLAWAGPDLSDVVDAKGLQRQIDEAERQQREFERASAKIETLSEERARLYTERETAYDRRAKGPQRVDLDALKAAVETARDALRPAKEALDEAERAFRSAERAKEAAITEYEQAKADVKRCETVLRERRAELDELEFNNALLKRVRQCRPMIADKLWNLVLSAVSTYFSEMRGEKSKVRKNNDGFTVDGHPVTGATLSGSTLDLLGLAIRVALVRTFMPMAPFLILDEPAAACDDGRTNNMLGFLASTGFKQIILVTHEDISQAVADNMITL